MKVGLPIIALFASKRFPDTPYPAAWVLVFCLAVTVALVHLALTAPRSREFWGLLAFTALSWILLLVEVLDGL